MRANQVNLKAKNTTIVECQLKNKDSKSDKKIRTAPTEWQKAIVNIEMHTHVKEWSDATATKGTENRKPKSK